jgi:hypothetical protein
MKYLAHNIIAIKFQTLLVIYVLISWRFIDWCMLRYVENFDGYELWIRKGVQGNVGLWVLIETGKEWNTEYNGEQIRI